MTESTCTGKLTAQWESTTGTGAYLALRSRLDRYFDHRLAGAAQASVSVHPPFLSPSHPQKNANRASRAACPAACSFMSLLCAFPY